MAIFNVLFTPGPMIHFCVGLINADAATNPQAFLELKGSLAERYSFFRCRVPGKTSIGFKLKEHSWELPLMEWLKNIKQGSICARAILIPRVKAHELYEQLEAEAGTPFQYPAYVDVGGYILGCIEVRTTGRKQTFLAVVDSGANEEYTHFSFREVDYTSDSEEISFESAFENYKNTVHATEAYMKNVFYAYQLSLRKALFFLENLDLKMSSFEEAERTVIPAAQKFGFQEWKELEPAKQLHAQILSIELFWILSWPGKKMRAICALLNYENVENEYPEPLSDYNDDDYLNRAFALSEIRYALHRALG